LPWGLIFILNLTNKVDQMNLNLNGKRALVCGSTQGIGLAIAEVLAEMGATITLFARNQDKLREVRDSLPATQGQSHDYLVADFNHTEEVIKEVDAYLETGKAFDILINNSGGPPGGPASEADPDEFRIAFERHLLVNQLLVSRLIPRMKENNFGRIVNIISTSVKAPIPGLGVSNTIRGAVANWAKTLSLELGVFGITVNNVLPGATMTGRLESIIENKAKKEGVTVETIRHGMMQEIPARRFAESKEIAIAAAFLCTKEAGYINGINLPVDGGRLPNL
jgi:3-oxoacyl-[acyl-carrier protein] reductase